jgi:hypothetical protein
MLVTKCCICVEIDRYIYKFIPINRTHITILLQHVNADKEHSTHLVLADPLHCDVEGLPSYYNTEYQHGLANPVTSCASGHIPLLLVIRRLYRTFEYMRVLKSIYLKYMMIWT